MTRKTLTGLLLAASTMTAGTLGYAYAQDTDDAARQAEIEAALAEAMGEAVEAHDHEHTPTTVHSGETAFELGDKEAYPDPDGFASMEERISYVFGRLEGQQIPLDEPTLEDKQFEQGLRKGFADDREHYALGYQQGYGMARQLINQQGEDFDLEGFIAGITDALKEENADRAVGYLVGHSYGNAELGITADGFLLGVTEAKQAQAPPAEGEEQPVPAKTKLSQEQVQETLQAFQAFMAEKQKNDAIAEGTAYIDSLKEEDGWKKTESGIAYRIIEAGEGDSPDADDVATMDYELRLLDGDKPGDVLQTSFDSPQTLPVSAGDVIKGWGEILQIMQPGATFETVIPFELGYGEQGSPPNIPPFSTLIFKMKMHSFEVVDNQAEEAAE